MKKILFLFFWMVSLTSSAYQVLEPSIVVDGFRYGIWQLTDSSLAAALYGVPADSEGELTIPDGIMYQEQWVPVKYIFNMDGANRESVTAVKLPSSLLTISSSAFKDFMGIRTIGIPATVEDIGDLAFSGCTSLTNKAIARGVL